MSFFSRRCLTVLLVAGMALAPFARAADSSTELMAAYVYNFARFVEWPATQFPSPLTPLVLCTPDAETLDGHLLRVHGRLAQNRRVVVRLVENGEQLTGCQLLFLPAQDDASIAGWLTAAAGKPLLTISNAPGFAARGGMIELFVKADRVHFDVQREVAAAAGLRISSRLLALARPAPGGAR